MSQNDFTKANSKAGIHGQAILDAGLNVFALDLLVESFTARMGGNTAPVGFTYKGVSVRLQISDKATN